MILLTVLEYLRNDTDEKNDKSLMSDNLETTREGFPTVVQCVQESKGQDEKGFPEDEVEELSSKQPSMPLDGTGKCVDRFKFLGNDQLQLVPMQLLQSFKIFQKLLNTSPIFNQMLNMSQI